MSCLILRSLSLHYVTWVLADQMGLVRVKLVLGDLGGQLLARGHRQHKHPIQHLLFHLHHLKRQIGRLEPRLLNDASLQ